MSLEFYGTEILGILRILRAGYVSGIWVWKSEDIELMRAGNVSGIGWVRKSYES